MFRKVLRRSLVTISILFIIFLLFIHFVAPHLIIYRPDRRSAEHHENNLPLPEMAKAMWVDGYHVQLSGTLFSPTEPAKGIVIFVHGIGSKKESFYDTANAYAKLGYHAFTFDQRAHGESEGAYITYGYYEKKDLIAIVDYLEGLYPDLDIGIWGSSLGGAVALQALAIEQRLKFGVISSTFADLGEVVHAYQRRYLKGISLGPFTDHTLQRAGRIASFPPEKIRPEVAARAITQPVLYIHGTTDRRISIEQGRRIFAQLASTDKTFVPVENAGHLDVFKVGGDRLSEQVVDWIAQRISQ